jgi:FixJ family two-component response regulator
MWAKNSRYSRHMSEKSFERVANGTANKVIALDLGISERTVELHRARGLRKMGTRTSAQLSQLMNVVLLSGEHDASGQSV